jgi:hypothetical protein
LLVLALSHQGMIGGAHLSGGCQLPLAHLSGGCQLPLAHLSGDCQLPLAHLSGDCQPRAVADILSSRLAFDDAPPQALLIYLHSIKYSGEGWCYQTDMPGWAVEDMG